MMTRWRLGDEVPIEFNVTNSSGTPSTPDAAPTVRIYSSSGEKVAQFTVPPKDRSEQTGYFSHFVRLGRAFSAGVYSWRATWEASSAAGIADGVFRIVAGGDADGSVIAMHYLDAGAAPKLVYQTDAGALKHGANPRV
jgi:hypothetical protein